MNLVDEVITSEEHSSPMKLLCLKENMLVLTCKQITHMLRALLDGHCGIYEIVEIVYTLPSGGTSPPSCVDIG